MFKGLSSSGGRKSAPPPPPSHRYQNDTDHKFLSRSTGDSEIDSSSSSSSDNDYDDDDDNNEIEDNSHGSESCPLCLEDMHYSDSTFKPCPCGYQICRFCWHRIREEENERCPACRRIYQDEASSSLSSASSTTCLSAPNHLQQQQQQSHTSNTRKTTSMTVKTKDSGNAKLFTNSTHNTHVPKGSIVLSKTRKTVSPGTGIYSVTPGTSSEYGNSSNTGSKPPPPPTTSSSSSSSIVAAILPSKKHLHELRVIQKNLVYVIGISTRITNEAILREHEYFGQFGKILKIVVNKRGGGEELSSSTNQITTSGSAYVTFQRNEDAEKAIFLVDGSVFDGRVLRATYGTTKYCSYFLRGIPCPNPGCMYLHEEGERDNSFTKEALSQGKMHMHSHLLAKGEGDALRQFGTSMLHLMTASSAPLLQTASMSTADTPVEPIIVDSHQKQLQSAATTTTSTTTTTTKTTQKQQSTENTTTTNYKESALSFLDRLKRWNSSSSESLLDELSLSPPPLVLDEAGLLPNSSTAGTAGIGVGGGIGSFDPFSSLRSTSTPAVLMSSSSSSSSAAMSSMLSMSSTRQSPPPKSFSPIIMRPLSQLSSSLETTPPPSPTIPIPSFSVLQPQPVQQARNVETLFSSFKGSPPVGGTGTGTGTQTKLKDSSEIEKEFFRLPQSSVLRGL